MMVPVLLGVIIIIFSLNYFMPACPVARRLGDAATPDQIRQGRDELGLNDPYVVQLGRFVGNIVRLDFGDSFHTGQPVTSEIAARFPNTFQLALFGVLLGLIIGIPLGILSATRQYSLFDSGATFLGLLGASIPNFWLGMMLIIVFSVNLGWLPAMGFDTPLHMIMPVTAIGTGSAAIIMRMTRSSMLENIRQDYVRTARAKGQSERVVIFRHALKNALLPIITVAGLQFGVLLGGAVLTENIFTIIGLGRFMVDSMHRVDSPVILSGVLFIALIFSFVNLAVDLLYGFVDPRIRSQYK